MKHDAWRRQSAAYPTQGTLQPRFNDVDMWQHLNNVAQIGLHGELLQQWLHAHLGPEPWRRAAPKLVVQANATDFLAEAHYPAPLATGVRLMGADDQRFTLATGLFQHGHCTGLHQATLGALDGDRAVPLPADWQAALQAAAAVQPPLPGATGEAAGAPDTLSDMATPLHPDQWPWQITLGSRFADADGQGHASDFTLARCAEQGRVQFLTKVFGDGRRSAPVGFMVAHVALRWHRRSVPPAAWQLGIGVSKIGERSLVVASALFDGAACVGTSTSVMVVIDHATRRPAALSAEARALLAPFQLSAG